MALWDRIRSVNRLRSLALLSPKSERQDFSPTLSSPTITDPSYRAASNRALTTNRIRMTNSLWYTWEIAKVSVMRQRGRVSEWASIFPQVLSFLFFSHVQAYHRQCKSRLLSPGHVVHRERSTSLEARLDLCTLWHQSSYLNVMNRYSSLLICDNVRRTFVWTGIRTKFRLFIGNTTRDTRIVVHTHTLRRERGVTAVSRLHDHDNYDLRLRSFYPSKEERRFPRFAELIYAKMNLPANARYVCGFSCRAHEICTICVWSYQRQNECEKSVWTYIVWGVPASVLSSVPWPFAAPPRNRPSP